MTLLSNTFSFCDLDDTLVISRRKSAELDQSTVGCPVAFSSAGETITFQTAAQGALYDWLSKTTRLIPTTGRSSKWLKRLKLGFTDYAICSFGGVILTPAYVSEPRRPEPRWLSYIGGQSELVCTTLTEVCEVIVSEANRSNIDVRVKVVQEFGTALYVSAKHNQHNALEIANLAHIVSSRLPQLWRIHLNGRSLAILPPFLGKEIAVDWFLKEIAGASSLILTAGDSLSDLPYMSLGDFALVPVPSQVFASIY